MSGPLISELTRLGEQVTDDTKEFTRNRCRALRQRHGSFARGDNV